MSYTESIFRSKRSAVVQMKAWNERGGGGSRAEAITPYQATPFHTTCDFKEVPIQLSSFLVLPLPLGSYYQEVDLCTQYECKAITMLCANNIVVIITNWKQMFLNCTDFVQLNIACCISKRLPLVENMAFPSHPPPKNKRERERERASAGSPIFW